MSDLTALVGASEDALLSEIDRLNKIITALMNRAERSAGVHASDFSLFQTTILLEEQVRSRTADLETALRENERIGRALSKSEAKFRGVVTQSLVGIAIIENGKFSYTNSKFAEILGYTPEEALGLGPVDIAAPGDRDLVADQIRRRISGEIDHTEYLFRALRKNRVEIHVECHSSVMDVDGQPALITLIIDVTERIRALRKLQELQEQLREQAIHDSLTGFYNRLPLGEFLDRELCLAQRQGHCVTAILADLDHFKLVNDSYGHLVGDEVLRAFAARIKGCSRASDLCCRYGGEEFLLVLPNTTNCDGVRRADQMRASISAQPLVSGVHKIRVTASFGVATYPQDGQTRDALINAADKALYAAKNAGRDRVQAFCAK